MTASPNIVIIMTDQQQARARRLEGFPLDTTPYLDSMAREHGTWFNRGYTTAPVCGPSRVSMLTGRYPGAHGVRSNANVELARYDKDIVDVVQNHGYQTAMIGKNHSHLTADRLDHWFALGHDAGYRYPESQLSDEERDFDEWIHDLRHGVTETPTPFPVECQGPYRAVSAALKWLSNRDSASPFFMWLSIAEPHNPYQVPDPYRSLFAESGLPATYGSEISLAQKGFKWEVLHEIESRALPRYDELMVHMRLNYYGMLRLIDDQIRRFDEGLQERNLSNDTIVFFVSDHGDFAGDFGLMRKGVEMPESLMRIPFQVWGGGLEPQAGPNPAHVSLADIAPTICDIVGEPIPLGVQGRSLWPLLFGGDYPEKEFASVYGEQGFGGLNYNRNDPIDHQKWMMEQITFNELNEYTQCGFMRMVRKGDWKLLYEAEGAGYLYNLVTDPEEALNLFDDPECSAVRNDLLQELLLQTIRATDPLPHPAWGSEPKSNRHNYWN